MCPVLLAELHAVLADTDVPGGRAGIGDRVDSDLREFRAPCPDITDGVTRVTGTGTGSTEQTHAPIIPDAADLGCHVGLEDSG